MIHAPAGQPVLFMFLWFFESKCLLDKKSEQRGRMGMHMILSLDFTFCLFHYSKLSFTVECILSADIFYIHNPTLLHTRISIGPVDHPIRHAAHSSTAQHSTAQHSTVQHSTSQHSTAEALQEDAS
jgi:hypothetical protein